MIIPGGYQFTVNSEPIMNAKRCKNMMFPQLRQYENKETLIYQPNSAKKRVKKS